MTELRRRMIEDMKLHGLSPTTQRVYVDAVRVLAEHYHRSPDRLSEDEIRQFFTYLTEPRRLAPCTIQVYVFAIKFLYQRTLRRPWPVLALLRVTRPKKLLVVLSPGEVWHLLNLVRQPAARMSLILMYSCGLRVSEATRLRVSDIDSRHVKNGSGGRLRGCYYLADQLNRAALSIATNLAESNGRFTKPDRRNFFTVARGSAQECVPLIEIARRRGFVTDAKSTELRDRLEEIARMLSGLINGLDKRTTA